MANTTVKIAFDLNAAGQGNFFTLDDPVKGVLGGTATDYPLAGDILTDVTADVRAVRVRRGRSNILERFQAGAADVTLDNRDRYYSVLPQYQATQGTCGGDQWAARVHGPG